jgi:hypothetical protein
MAGIFIVIGLNGAAEEMRPKAAPLLAASKVSRNFPESRGFFRVRPQGDRVTDNETANDAIGRESWVWK